MCIFSPNKCFAQSVTQSGAKLASNVALATVVYLIDQCHETKSIAKKNPAIAMSPIGRFWRLAEEAGFNGDIHSINHINGKANKTR